MVGSQWLKHGFWNTLEHGLVRVTDALTTLILLWVLSPEIFSKLALSQALVAPFLLFFIAPETIVYREFGNWKKQGAHVVQAHLISLRWFGWSKILIALLLSVVLARLAPGEGSFELRFWAILWAFSLVLAPQFCGADREFLRLDLKLRRLNLISLYQKATLLAGTAGVAYYFPGEIKPIALAGVFSALTSVFLAFFLSQRVFKIKKSTATQRKKLPRFSDTIGFALKSYTLWVHISGVIQTWVQTMDLFFLGFFRFPAREVGLFAAVLKIANFSTAIPVALTNIFNVWLGRRVAGQGEKRERQEVRKLSFLLFLGTAAQALIIYLLGPWILEFLSRGRWTPQEQEQMIQWLGWLIGAGVLSSSALLLNGWLWVRRPAPRVFFQIYLPWGLICIASFAIMVGLGGPDMGVRAKVLVAGVHLVFLIFAFTRGPARAWKQ